MHIRKMRKRATRYGSHAHGERGFTLIEIAIVLVIIGLLIGLGAALLGPLTEQSAFRRSRERVKACKEAIIGFVASNRRLPTAGEFPTICNERDALGRPLVYLPDDATRMFDGATDRADLTVAPPNICCAAVPPATRIDVAVNDLAMGAGFRTDVAFLVLSTGENRAQDGVFTDNTNIGGTNFTSYNIDPYTAAYDDIVEYVTLLELRDVIACEPLQAIAASLPEGIEETSYSAQLQAKGGCPNAAPPPYNWVIVGPDPLAPIGLTLNADGSITGTVNTSGATPPGTFPAGVCSGPITFTASATDANGGTDNQSFTINTFPQTLRVINTELPTGTEGQAYTTTLLGSGGSDNYTWNYLPIGGLPPNLNLVGATISGNLLDPGSAGDWPITVDLTDGCSTTSKAFTITVNPAGAPALSCTLTANPDPITSGQTTDLTWVINNGPADGTWAAPVPGGTCVDFLASNGGTCTTAALGATTTFTLDIDDGTDTSSCSVTVTVNPPACAALGLAGAPVDAYNCQGYADSSITAVGGVSPFTWSQTGGSLPAGISFCSLDIDANCDLTGAAVFDSPGAYNFTAQVTDSCATPGPQTVSQGFTINLDDACYGGGVTLRNSVGGPAAAARRWYRRNGGACTQWNKNTNITVLPTDSYVIYSDNSCTTQCAGPSDYCDQKSFDVNGDCNTQLNAPCVFSDR